MENVGACCLCCCRFDLSGWRKDTVSVRLMCEYPIRLWMFTHCHFATLTSSFLFDCTYLQINKHPFPFLGFRIFCSSPVIMVSGDRNYWFFHSSRPERGQSIKTEIGKQATPVVLIRLKAFNFCLTTANSYHHHHHQCPLICLFLYFITIHLIAIEMRKVSSHIIGN